MPSIHDIYNAYATGGGPAAAGSSGLPNYNAAPTPTQGQGAYGLVPGTIAIPPSRYQQTTGVAPGLANNTQLTNNIMSELQGDINPQALKNMQDAAASYGISSGMPGSNAIPGTLAFNKNLRNIGLDTLAVQRQGQQDYLSALAGIGGQQTDPNLAAEIAAHNAQLKAAPDPATAAQTQLAQYWAALNALRGPGGGTGQGASPSGGTGTFAPQPGMLGGTPSPVYQGGGGGGTFGGTTATTPDGSSFTWTGQDFGGLFGDLGGGSPSYGGTPSPSLYVPPSGVGGGYGADASNSDYWNFGYDQSAPPDLASNAGYFDENAFYGGY